MDSNDNEYDQPLSKREKLLRIKSKAKEVKMVVLSQVHDSSSSKKETARVTRINGLFPNTVNPVVFSAPMLGTANGRLAAEVSLGGGFGFIPGGYNFSPPSPSSGVPSPSAPDHLAQLSNELTVARKLLGLQEATLTPLPVGVGFILCHDSTATHFIERVIPVLQDHSPQAVWLFAPRVEDVAGGVIKEIIERLHDNGFVVFYQVGNVKGVREAIRDGADVVVAQGTDAGGHQYVRGAGTMSFLREAVEVVKRENIEREKKGEGGVMVVGAGGVVDGWGVVGALALGAEAVVMGTRFIMATEATTPDFRRELIAKTEDGALSTFKHTVMDDIQGSTIWPEVYDGRAIVGDSVEDHLRGVPAEENIRLFKEAAEKGETSRMITWAGSGVGLVNKVQPAGEIVREVREEALQRIKELQTLF
ncbi:putative 2-nitropropane dioxygenase [Triangularia verruculosa]|uniref:2-nitropropane dioxygenase n=1 Tax=Triangularia verruculosa TaxID=2587418 RepID=A0AAN6X916_9PEZI|nr:putative 2-nitropropane dioxygenase [Triangularia verruculosa]